MTKDEALRLALEALEEMQNAIYNIGGEHAIDLNFAIEQADVSEFAITAIKAALEAKDEPVAWMNAHDVGFKKSEFGNTPTIPLYTTPPPVAEPHKRKPLTYVELRRIANDCGLGANNVSARTQVTVDSFARAIEAAHGIKGEK